MAERIWLLPTRRTGSEESSSEWLCAADADDVPRYRQIEFALFVSDGGGASGATPAEARPADAEPGGVGEPHDGDGSSASRALDTADARRVTISTR